MRSSEANSLKPHAPPVAAVAFSRRWSRSHCAGGSASCRPPASRTGRRSTVPSSLPSSASKWPKSRRSASVSRVYSASRTSLAWCASPRAAGTSTAPQRVRRRRRRQRQLGAAVATSYRLRRTSCSSFAGRAVLLAEPCASRSARPPSARDHVRCTAAPHHEAPLGSSASSRSSACSRAGRPTSHSCRRSCRHGAPASTARPTAGGGSLCARRTALLERLQHLDACREAADVDRLPRGAAVPTMRPPPTRSLTFDPARPAATPAPARRPRRRLASR